MLDGTATARPERAATTANLIPTILTASGFGTTVVSENDVEAVPTIIYFHKVRALPQARGSPSHVYIVIGQDHGMM